MPREISSSMILLADDDEVVRTMVRDMLHILGYQVMLAANGEELISLYQGSRADIDVIILDWYMPGLSGMEILDQLWEINPDVKVILATGLGHPREFDAIIKSGHPVSILQKPYLIKDLQSEIARVLHE